MKDKSKLRLSLQAEAEDLAAEIVCLPDLTDDVEVYLKDIPERVQEFLERAVIVNGETSLSKDQLLDNFIAICDAVGMTRDNPFCVFIKLCENRWNLLHNKL